MSLRIFVVLPKQVFAVPSIRIQSQMASSGLKSGLYPGKATVRNPASRHGGAIHAFPHLLDIHLPAREHHQHAAHMQRLAVSWCFHQYTAVGLHFHFAIGLFVYS
jgi:hypothetical protein